MAQCSGSVYRIREGDTIVSIARYFNVKLADLIKANPEITDHTSLMPGDQICIPRGRGTEHLSERAFGVRLPAGYRIEKFADGLQFPTGISFNDAGEMFAVESGYRTGQAGGSARILKIGPGGRKTEIARGFTSPVTGITWYKDSFFVSESGYPGQVTRVFMDGIRKTILGGLPTGGDHAMSQVVFGPDGKMYFGLGSATNSGVVGPDNTWLAKRPKFHDIPSRNTVFADGRVVSAKFPSTAGIFRANADGTELEVMADGLRSPCGIGFCTEGKMFCTENGMDSRGSRPVANAWDSLEEVRVGAWYGWPDYSARVPVTDSRFKPANGPQPEFLLKNHPPLAPGPAALFAPRTAAAKFDFSTNPAFGYPGEAFISLFGCLHHRNFPLPESAGFKVVRVNTRKGEVKDFLVILNPADPKGPGHPIEARFCPAGSSLYIVDFGKPAVDGSTGARTGAVWRISRS